MNFGQAIEHLKTGGRVSRSGWNGKGMFIFLNKGKVGAISYLGSNYDETDMKFYRTVPKVMVPIARITELFESDDPEALRFMHTVNTVGQHLFDLEIHETSEGADSVQTVMPSLVMKTADGAIVTGWLASQIDILAEDWEVSK